MTGILWVLYAAVAIFLIAVISRGVKIARTPLHLRWELYPVPHEGKRARHGGSRLEEVDWWTKAMREDHLGDLRVMIPEILLLKGLWEHNRRLWFPSWALHFGLYLLIGNIVLALIAAIMQLVGAGGLESGFYRFLLSFMAVLFWGGNSLGLLGAVLMLGYRIGDAGLRRFASPSHYFNLLLLGAIFLTGLVWQAGNAGQPAVLSGLWVGVLSAGPLPELGGWGMANLGLALFFIVYLPFTHMSHFFTKYFTYHAIRWEDTPNLPGGKLEKRILANVSRKPTWAAPHVQADGTKTWADLAGETGTEHKAKAEE